MQLSDISYTYNIHELEGPSSILSQSRKYCWETPMKIHDLMNINELLASFSVQVKHFVHIDCWGNPTELCNLMYILLNC